MKETNAEYRRLHTHAASLAPGFEMRSKSALENGPHNAVHNAIGGDMTTAASPTDPLFFMHHANVDRLWYQWREAHPNRNPSNMDEVLKPASLSDVPGSSVVDRTLLPYSYA